MEEPPGDNQQANRADYNTTLTPFANAPQQTTHLVKRTIGWGDAIAVFVGAFVLFAVGFPVYRAMHPDNRTRGVVVDENMRPIPGAVLEARDRAGRTLGTATTDDNGEVLWNRAWVAAGTTFGKYGVSRFAPSTGGRAHVYLSPLVLHRVRVRNAATGLLQPGMSLVVNPESRTYSQRDGFKEGTLKTSAFGVCSIGIIPSTARMHFYCEDGSFAVWNVVATVVWRKAPPHQKDVLYDVTVVPTGTLTGRAVYPDGTPVPRGVVFATLISGAPDNESRYLRAAIDPTTKTFRMHGLLPGRWRVGYEPWYGARDKSQGGRELLIQSGQTKTLREPLRVYWTNDKP